jgi:hypothetical protein
MRGKPARSKFIAAVAALFLAGCATLPERKPVNAGLIIDHVTVVDVRDGKLVPDRAIIIADDRIKAIVAAGSVSATGTARLVDGGSAYVVPGYNDMHAHNLNNASPETSLPLMLAHGVTGFRQMAGVPPVLAQYKAGALNLPQNAPALLAMPGTVLAGPAVATPTGAQAEVGRQKMLGADFIKVVDLPPAAFLAAADEAERLGLPYSGHLPANVDPRQAMTHGMDAIEHMGPTISLLLSCSSDEARIRAMMAAAPPLRQEIDFGMDPVQLARLVANPMMLTPAPGFALIERVLATYDEDKCRALAKDFAASGTWIVPTLTRLEAMQLGNTPSLRENPALRFVPADSLAMWREVGENFDAKLSSPQRKTLAGLFDRQLAMTKLFDQEGVKMLAGSDFGGQWIPSGQSLHHEFDLLARAGVPPLRILQMTTIDASRYLKREGGMGTVEAGKGADLVLLAADPTRDAAHLHGIRAVVRAGRYIGRQELDAITEMAVKALQQ